MGWQEINKTYICRGCRVDMLSKKDLGEIICIACGKKYKDHTRGGLATKFSVKSLMECMFRIQGSYVSDGINDAPEPEPVHAGDNSNGSKGIDDIPPLAGSIPDDIITGDES
jgi:hypothetical protein